MGARSSAVLAALFASTLVLAQFGNTFAYTGEDALRDQANVHFVNYGGFANNLALVDQTVVAAYLPSLFYEAGYLLRPANRKANLELSVTPEVFLNVLFMAREKAPQ